MKKGKETIMLLGYEPLNARLCLLAIRCIGHGVFLKLKENKRFSIQ